jgi:hypothetical protein
MNLVSSEGSSDVRSMLSDIDYVYSEWLTGITTAAVYDKLKQHFSGQDGAYSNSSVASFGFGEQNVLPIRLA